MAVATSPVCWSDLQNYHNLLMNYLSANYRKILDSYTKDEIDKIIDVVKIEEWQSDVEYKKGKIVIHDNCFYLTKIDIVSTTFDEKDWVALGGLNTFEKDDIDFAKEYTPIS